jgi:formylmethanofuran--tetrahydromethanopterin N-formyltransferase
MGETMNYRGVRVEDTFCECTDVYIARLLLTASSGPIAVSEAIYLCGFGIITAAPIQGCVEGVVPESRTPDGRPGIVFQLNAPTAVGLDAFRKALLDRLYIVPHLPTCSLYDGTECAGAEVGKGRGEVAAVVDVAGRVGRWGDGYEAEDVVGGRETVRIPIMTGDQQIERSVRVTVGTDGVLEVFATSQAACLSGASAAASRIVREVPGVAVFNYPVGGISGAKVGGTHYPKEGVTINEPYCPTVRDRVATKIPDDASAVIEFPLVAVSLDAIRRGLKAAIDAFAATEGIVAITAPSFGGAWGGRRLPLRDVVPAEDERGRRG